MMNDKKAKKMAVDLANKIIRLLRTDDFKDELVTYNDNMPQITLEDENPISMNLTCVLYNSLQKLIGVILDGSGLLLTEEEIEQITEGVLDVDLTKGNIVEL